MESNKEIVVDMKEMVKYISIRLPKVKKSLIVKILDIEEEFLKEKGVIDRD